MDKQEREKFIEILSQRIRDNVIDDRDMESLMSLVYRKPEVPYWVVVLNNDGKGIETETSALFIIKEEDFSNILYSEPKNIAMTSKQTGLNILGRNGEISGLEYIIGLDISKIAWVFSISSPVELEQFHGDIRLIGESKSIEGVFSEDLYGAYRFISKDIDKSIKFLKDLFGHYQTKLTQETNAQIQYHSKDGKMEIYIPEAFYRADVTEIFEEIDKFIV